MMLGQRAEADDISLFLSKISHKFWILDCMASVGARLHQHVQ